MRLLIDTHLALWFVDGSPRISQSVRELIVRPDNEVFVSDISLWEIAIKRKKTPDVLRYSANEYAKFFEASDFALLHLDQDAIDEYERLDVSQADSRHRDPFDRMLICQAKAADLLLLTHDRRLALYEEPLVQVV